MQHGISTAFAVPLYTAAMPNCDSFNQALVALFKQYSTEQYKNPNPYTLRNDSLFESRFDLFQWPDKPIQDLANFCCQHVYRCVGELNQYAQSELASLRLGVDSWFHITRDQGFFGVHNHPMASWSGVYCVSDGNPDPSIPHNGQLSFVNPFILSSMFMDAGNARLKQPFANGNLGFSLIPGQLVLFPSWLLHEVKPFYGSGERVTVAFNCWFQM